MVAVLVIVICGYKDLKISLGQSWRFVITLVVLVHGHHHGEGHPVVVEALRLLDGLVFTEDHGVAGPPHHAVLNVRQLLTEVLRLYDQVVAAVEVPLTVLVMSVVVATFPEVHEEESDCSENDEDEGEVVTRLLVPGVDVEVARGRDPQQDGNTASSLNKTPTSGKVFGANPENILF